ncbi:MAG: RNA 2',3'-cyclic phosphodiesterase [Alphaproteobacteria bacterium]
MTRLFVAIELPEELRERLALMQGGVPGANWVDPDNFHVTLRFIGETAESAIADIDETLARIVAKPFDLSLAGMDTFARGREPTSLWVGVERAEPLMSLQKRIDQALTRAGFPTDEKRYTPHVTLARLQRAPEARLAGFIAEHNLFRAEPFRVERFTLFSSQLGSAGPVYSVEADYPLGSL